MRNLLAFIKSPFTTNILLSLIIASQIYSTIHTENAIYTAVRMYEAVCPRYYKYFSAIELSLDAINRSNKEIRDEIDRVVNHMPYVSTSDIEKHLKSIKEDVMGMSIDVEMIKKSMWTLEVNTEK